MKLLLLQELHFVGAVEINPNLIRRHPRNGPLPTANQNQNEKRL